MMASFGFIGSKVDQLVVDKRLIWPSVKPQLAFDFLA
jgi:hypothetical protein